MDQGHAETATGRVRPGPHCVIATEDKNPVKLSAMTKKEFGTRVKAPFVAFTSYAETPTWQESKQFVSSVINQISLPEGSNTGH
jgi:hypothetical protein